MCVVMSQDLQSFIPRLRQLINYNNGTGYYCEFKYVSSAATRVESVESIAEGPARRLEEQKEEGNGRESIVGNCGVIRWRYL